MTGTAIKSDLVTADDADVGFKIEWLLQWRSTLEVPSCDKQKFIELYCDVMTVTPCSSQET